MDVSNRSRPLDRVAARLLETRWLMRAPIGLYRIGLGGLLGSRLVMIEHRGRTSGKTRYVVVECVERPSPAVVMVASGFGATAQWYRNIAANGVARVWTGWRRSVPSTARLLDAAESAERLREYAAVHPKAWDRLHGAMAEAQGGEPDIRIVELTMRS